VISDRTRLSIRDKLEPLIGTEEADALAEALLHPQWDQVATKDDLRVLSAELRTEIRDSTIAQMRWAVATNTGLAAVILAAVKLLF